LERARRAADAAACFAAAAAATRNERERAFLIERVRSITPD
jgi:predicted RNA polymerase sigma factor